jgi:hypothetical protein
MCLVVMLTGGDSIAEMAGGWGNHIMQDEASFMVLDATLIFIAVYLLTIFHPGLYFPQMGSGYQKEAEEHGLSETGAETSESNTEAGKVETSQKPS